MYTPGGCGAERALGWQRMHTSGGGGAERAWRPRLDRLGPPRPDEPTLGRALPPRIGGAALATEATGTPAAGVPRIAATTAEAGAERHAAVTSWSHTSSDADAGAGAGAGAGMGASMASVAVAGAGAGVAAAEAKGRRAPAAMAQVRPQKLWKPSSGRGPRGKHGRPHGQRGASTDGTTVAAGARLDVDGGVGVDTSSSVHSGA